MRRPEVQHLVIGSLLLAMSILIPLSMGGLLGVAMGPFTATLASHVPTFIAMLYGPWWPALWGSGQPWASFLAGLVVGSRAAMHIPVGISRSPHAEEKLLTLQRWLP